MLGFDDMTDMAHRVDPDRISRHLPEREQYLKYEQNSAPEKLHPEASMIQEVLTLIARERKRSLVVDGSLSDGEYVSIHLK